MRPQSDRMIPSGYVHVGLSSVRYICIISYLSTNNFNLHPYLYRGWAIFVREKILSERRLFKVNPWMRNYVRNKIAGTITGTYSKLIWTMWVRGVCHLGMCNEDSIEQGYEGNGVQRGFRQDKPDRWNGYCFQMSIFPTSLWEVYLFVHLHL